MIGGPPISTLFPNTTLFRSTKTKNATGLHEVYDWPAGNRYLVDYTFTGYGMVKVDITFTPAKEGTAELPRVGMRMRFPAEFGNINYLGRGPEENYGDRNHGTFQIGRAHV